MSTNTAPRDVLALDTLPDCIYDGREFWLALGPLYRDGRRMFHAWAQNGDDRHTVKVLVIIHPGDDVMTVRIDHYIGEAEVNSTPHRTLMVVTAARSYYDTPAAIAAMLHGFGYLTD